MSYLRILVATVAVIVGGAATLNFFVDPAGVFRSDALGPEQYAEALLASSSGLWWPDSSYEDRGIKKALATHAHDFDCVVIGSSHVMQITTLGSMPALRDTCRSTLNLGVSGAGLEDHLTLAYLAMSDGRPRKIVLGADPWILAYGKDQRWSYYGVDYQKARRAVLGEMPQNAGADPFFGKIANLFSLEYTLQSLRNAKGDLAGAGSRRAIAPAPVLDETVGGLHPVLRPDGSLIYSAQNLAGNVNQIIPLGGTTYKTGGGLNQDKAVSAYRTLLRWIRKHGTEPVLLLTPYHGNVLKAASSPNAVALRDTETALRKLADEERVTLMGSYDPKRVGCNDNEFSDFMHARPSCLARLRRLEPSARLHGNKEVAQ